MTKLRVLSAALVTAAMFAAPAMARESHAGSRHLVERINAAPGARYVEGRLCYPAPRVGAFATQPWDSGPAPCEPVAY
jgi:hypothetical protein